MRLLSILMGMALLAASVLSSACISASDAEYRADDPAIAEGSPEMWALACDAIHTSTMQVGFDRLRWGPATKANIELVKKNLAEGPWDVKNREDALRRIVETQKGSHSQLFWQLGKYLENASPDEQKAYIAAHENDPDELNQIKIAAAHYPRLKEKGLLGWDLARCIALCRRAYTAGYLERQEAWSFIMPMARKLRATFTSWEDVSNNYLLGRRFWCKYRADEGNPILEQELAKLLKDEKSVWRSVPWNLDLVTPM